MSTLAIHHVANQPCGKHGQRAQRNVDGVSASGRARQSRADRSVAQQERWSRVTRESVQRHSARKTGLHGLPAQQAVAAASALEHAAVTIATPHRRKSNAAPNVARGLVSCLAGARGPTAVQLAVVAPAHETAGSRLFLRVVASRARPELSRRSAIPRSAARSTAWSVTGVHGAHVIQTVEEAQ